MKALELEPAPELEPWKYSLFFETFVDGQRWEPVATIAKPAAVGRSWRGRGSDELYADCETNAELTRPSRPGLPAGVHSVEMRASIPGGPTLTTLPLEVSLDCDPTMPGPMPGSMTESSSGCDCRTCGARSGSPLALPGVALWALFGPRVRKRNSPCLRWRA